MVVTNSDHIKVADSAFDIREQNDEKLDMDVASIAERVRNGEIPPQDLKLLPHQVDHFHRIVDNILPVRLGYLDGSMTGRGKTIVTAAVSISYGIPIFVICPNTVKKVWLDITAAYGVEYINILTYDLLAGRKPLDMTDNESRRETELSHGYLTRIDTPKEKEKLSYRPTQKLIGLVSSNNSGVLFVFDECQSIKNHSTARFRACRAVTHTLMKIGQCSRFAALSASPFDKIEHAIAFFRLFNIYNSAQLYTKRKATRQVYFQGIQEILDYAEKLDPIQTKLLMYTHNNDLSYDTINQVTSKEFVFAVYNKIIKNCIGSSASNPKDFEDTKNITSGELYIYDGYFNVPKEDRESLRNNIKALHGIAEPIINGTEERSMNHLAKMTKSKRAIEKDKVYTFAYLAAMKLNEKSSNRVAIIMNFIDSIESVAEALHEYNPMVLTGKTKNRGDIIDRFQKPNDEDRLIIMNTKIGGQGISLHDLYGNRETSVFVSPDYSIINIFQAAGRFYRTGLQSDVYIYLVYGVHEGCSETNIINALATKNKVLKGSIPGTEMESLEDDVKNKILFPGEYPKYLEEDDEKDNVDKDVVGTSSSQTDDTLHTDENTIIGVD